MLLDIKIAKGSTLRLWLTLCLTSTAVLGGFMLARLPLAYIVALSAALVYLFSLIYDPLAGLGAAMFLGPLWAWLMNQPSAIPAHIGQYSLLIFLLLSFANLVIRKQNLVAFPPLLGALLAFLLPALVSLWNAVDSWNGFTEFAKWVQMALVFVIVYDRLKNPKNLYKPVVMWVVLIASGLLQACIGIWQFALRGDGPEPFAISSRFYRAYGTFMQPNPYAGFVAMMAAILVGVSLILILEYVRKWVQRRGQIGSVKPAWLVMLLSSTFVLVLGVVGSWSRGGWVGFAVAVVIMSLLVPRKWQWGIVLGAVLVLSGWMLLSAGIVPENLVDRLSGLAVYTQYSELRSVGITDANFSTLERMAHWQAALEMWRTRFWLGIGLGGYASAYPEFGLPNWTLPLGHAHNIYLNMLAETGILGFSGYMVFLGVLFYRLVKSSRVLTGWRRGAAIGLTGAWTHMAVHNLVDNIMVNNVHIHLGVMLALSAWVISTAEADMNPDIAAESRT